MKAIAATEQIGLIDSRMAWRKEAGDTAETVAHIHARGSRLHLPLRAVELSTATARHTCHSACLSPSSHLVAHGM